MVCCAERYTLHGRLAQRLAGLVTIERLGCAHACVSIALAVAVRRGRRASIRNAVAPLVGRLLGWLAQDWLLAVKQHEFVESREALPVPDREARERAGYHRSAQTLRHWRVAQARG